MNDSTDTLDDKILVSRAVAGEPDCYGVLMLRHAPAMRHFIASKLGKCRSEVDDVTQETFVKAWLGLSGFRFEAKFRTWLGQVAINEVLTVHRRKRSRPRYAESANLDVVPAMIEAADQRASGAEMARVVRSAVSKLPAKYRETLTLCDLQEMPEREAAAVAGTTVPALKARRFRARKMLAAVLAQQRH